MYMIGKWRTDGETIPETETRRFLTPRHATLLLELLNRTGNSVDYGEDWDEYKDQHTHSRLRLHLSTKTFEAIAVTYFKGKHHTPDAHWQVFLTHTSPVDSGPIVDDDLLVHAKA